MSAIVSVFYFFIIAIGITEISCGYKTNSLQNLLDALHTIHGSSIASLNQLDLLEFGSQEIHDYIDGVEHKVFRQYNYTLPSRDSIGMQSFFNHIGINYLNIDIDGEYNALKLDVRTNITSSIGNRFDIITNLGFTEHVGEADVEDNLLYNQYMVFKNMHEFGKQNAIFFHELPYIGAWYQHGVCHYDIKFFKQLASYNNYEIIYLYKTNYHGFRSEAVSTAFLKTSLNSFMSFEDFKHLEGIVSTYSDWITFRISFDIHYSSNQEVLKKHFYINTSEVTSIDRAKDICTTDEDMKKLEYNNCIELVVTTIEQNKIGNTIRSLIDKELMHKTSVN